MRIATLTPTLGDRPKFVDFCKKRILNQTIQPDIMLFVDYKNTNGKVDIAKRYKRGIESLLSRGIDLIIFIEDDDYYPVTYIEETIDLWLNNGKPALMGCKETVYYHLGARQYLSVAPKHCSAYCTSVGRGIKYDVCEDYEAYYDFKLWKANNGVQVDYIKKPIGIKHGIGKCGGSGHSGDFKLYNNHDQGLMFLKTNTDKEAFTFYRNMFNPILINILTRTHNRPNRFEICRNSVTEQTYKNINHIVGSVDCDYYPAYVKLKEQTETGQKPSGYGCSPAPYNLHLNELAKGVKSGWVMYLDDDDKLTSDSSIQTIVDSIDNDNQLLLWRVSINGFVVPDGDYWGKIEVGHISGIGFAFHSKHLPVDWGGWTCGDFKVIKELSKKLEIKLIDKVLTQTQGKPSRGL